MLTYTIARIPPEGHEIDQALDASEVHIEGERSFALLPGGQVRGHLEKGDDESLHLRGRLAARLGLECGRCLESFEQGVDQELDLFWLPRHPGAVGEEEEEVELSDHDMVVAYYSGETLDVGDTVREQLLLAVPMKPLCRPECPGLCSSCGARLETGPCDCRSEPEIDPRLAPLADLFGRDRS